jgi:lipopolysaccharide export system ATP-binding protein
LKADRQPTITGGQTPGKKPGPANTIEYARLRKLGSGYFGQEIRSGNRGAAIRSWKADVLDELLTLFRRRLAPSRERDAAGWDGRLQIDLQSIGGPINLPSSDWIPQAEPRMQRLRRRLDGDGRKAPHDAKHNAEETAQSGLLAVHAVEKSFASRTVVKGASLYVRRGEAVGLLGPNGAGKTTIFYMITGLIKADRGSIELDGHDVTALPMYQRARLGIGYLPQEASIFRGLNVEDNIRAVLEVVEPDRRRRERDLDALLEEFDIARLRKTPSIALSGGERRRVEIARALASRPNYMLLDEPFAGIDPIAVGDLQMLVRHLTNRGIGVLITDHNVRETLGLTDRAYIIYSGEVLMEGLTDEIVNHPEVRRLYLGEEFRL